MDEKTFNQAKEKWQTDYDRLMDFEAQLLDCVKELFDLLNERIPLARQLQSDGERLTRAAQALGKGEVFKVRILANLQSPAEVVHDFMARYAERHGMQGKGAKLDYESLVSNRIRPAPQPEIVTAPRKLRVLPSSETPSEKKGRGAGLTTYNRQDMGAK